MYVAKAIKKKEYPTKAEVEAAIIKADSEDGSRDPRDLMSILGHVASVSPRIKGHIKTRYTGVSAFGYDIKAYDNADVSKQKQRLSKAIERIMNTHLEAELYGIYLAGVEFEFDAELGQVPIIKPFHRTDLDKQDDGRIMYYSEDTLNEVNFECLKDVDESPERGGILRSIIFTEMALHGLMFDWASLSKRMKGIVTASIDADGFLRDSTKMGLTTEQISQHYAEIENSLKTAGEGNYLQTLKSVEIKLNSLVDAATGSAYSIHKKELDSDIAIALLGQANTAQLPSNGGSRAALQVLNLIRSDILYNDMNRVKRLVDTLIQIDYKMNVTDGKPPYSFEWIFDDSADVLSNATVFETISRINGQVPISKAEFYTKLNIKVPIDGEETMILGSSGGLGL